MTHGNGTTHDRGFVTIVLPAKNEEDAIVATIRALPVATLEAMGFGTEIVVLDGNSQDATAELARREGARVIPDREPGKAAALRNARNEFRGDYIVMLDADGTYAPDAIPRLLTPLVRGEADVMMGHRLIQDGSMKGTHLVGNVMLSMLATTLFRRYCPDVCTGLWAFRRDVLRSLPIRSEGFGLEVEMYALSQRLGYRVSFVRVDYLPRDGSPKLNFGTDGLQIVRTLVQRRFRPIDEEERGGGGPPSKKASPGVHT